MKGGRKSKITVVNVRCDYNCNKKKNEETGA